MEPNSAGSSSDAPPPRRRLVKASSHVNLDDSRKREPPPGFTNSDRSQSPSSSPSSLPSTPTTTFRDRDKASARSVNKDSSLEHLGNIPHGQLKSGRPYNSAPPGGENRPLVRRAEGSWRHEAPGQKHGNDIKMQQAKKAAVLRAQQAGATGNFKSVDSQFNNYLIPVIPVQFISKSQPHAMELG